MRNHFERIQADEELLHKTLERAKRGRKKRLIPALSAAAAVLALVVGLSFLVPSFLPKKDGEKGNLAEGLVQGAPPREEATSSSALGDASLPEAYPTGGAENARPEGQPQQEVSGRLTAAVLDDNACFKEWLEQKNAQKFDAYGLKADRRLTVTVSGANGEPLPFASVLLVDAQGQALYRAVTDIRGRAYLFYDYGAKAPGTPAKLLAEFLGKTAEAAVVPGQSEYALSLSAALMAADELDLMFVIDTTGSMGDELDYLKTETEQLLRNLTLSCHTRMSVNFYRDEGDAYVVKANPFTEDTKTVLTQLRQESVDGGGDYPEAVEKALANAVFEHEWRENSVKIAFLVLDAPAHTIGSVCDSLKDSIAAAAARGIRLVPVMASGADETTETLCRELALFTGGRFVFLTDHSGLGNAHREPITTVSYEVKPLITILEEVIYEYLKMD